MYQFNECMMKLETTSSKAFSQNQKNIEYDFVNCLNDYIQR